MEAKGAQVPAAGQAGGMLVRLPERHLRPGFGQQVLLGRAAAALLLQVPYISQQWLTAVTVASAAFGSPQEPQLPLGAALPHRHHALLLLGSAALALSSNLVLLINGLLAAASVVSISRRQAATQPAGADQSDTASSAHGTADARGATGRKLELQQLQSAKGSVYDDHATAVNVLATVMHTCAQLVACAADTVLRGAPPPASRLAAVAAAAGLNLAVNGDAWWAFLPQLGAVLVAAAALAAAAAPTVALSGPGGGHQQHHRQVGYLAGAALQLAVAAGAAVAMQWWLRRRWALTAAAAGSAGAARAATGSDLAEAASTAPASKYITMHRLYRVWSLPAGYCLNGATALLLPVSEGDQQAHDSLTSYCQQQHTAPPLAVRMSTSSRYSQGWSPLLRQDEDSGCSRSSVSSGSTQSSRRAHRLFRNHWDDAPASTAAQAGPMQPPGTPSQMGLARTLSHAGVTRLSREAILALAAAEAEAEGGAGAGPAASAGAEDGGRGAEARHAAAAVCEAADDLRLRGSTDAADHLAMRQLRAACATLPAQLPSSAAAGHPLAGTAAGALTMDELLRQALSTGGTAYSRGPSFDIQHQHPDALADALFSTSHAVSSYNYWMQPSPLLAHHPHQHHSKERQQLQAQQAAQPEQQRSASRSFERRSFPAAPPREGGAASAASVAQYSTASGAQQWLPRHRLSLTGRRDTDSTARQLEALPALPLQSPVRPEAQSHFLGHVARDVAGVIVDAADAGSGRTRPRQRLQEDQQEEEDSARRIPHLLSTTQLHALPHGVPAGTAATREPCAAALAAAAGPASAPPAAPGMASSGPQSAQLAAAVSEQLFQLSITDIMNSGSALPAAEQPAATWHAASYQRTRAPPADVTAGIQQLGGEGGGGQGSSKHQRQGLAAAAAAAGLGFDEADVISGRVDLVQQLFALMPDAAASQLSPSAGADDGIADTRDGADLERRDRLGSMSQSVRARPLSTTSASRSSQRAGMLVSSPCDWPSTSGGGAAGDMGHAAGSGRSGTALSGPSGVGAGASLPAHLQLLMQRSRLASGVLHAQQPTAQQAAAQHAALQQPQPHPQQPQREDPQLLMRGASDMTWVRMRIVHPVLLASADYVPVAGADGGNPVAHKPHAAAPSPQVRQSDTSSTSYADFALRSHDTGLQAAEQCAAGPGDRGYDSAHGNALAGGGDGDGQSAFRASADGGPLGCNSSNTSLQQHTAGWSVATADGDSRSTLLSGFGARALTSGQSGFGIRALASAGQNGAAAPAPAAPSASAGTSFVVAASQPAATPASALFGPNGSGFLATLAVYPHGPNTATASVTPSISASAASSVHLRTQAAAIAAALGPRMCSVGSTSAAAGVFNLQQGSGFAPESNTNGAAAPGAASGLPRDAQSSKGPPAAPDDAGNNLMVPSLGGASAMLPLRAMGVRGDRQHAAAAVRSDVQGRAGAAAVLDAAAAAAAARDHQQECCIAWEEEEWRQSQEVLRREQQLGLHQHQELQAAWQLGRSQPPQPPMPSAMAACDGAGRGGSGTRDEGGIGAHTAVTPSGRQLIPLASAAPVMATPAAFNEVPKLAYRGHLGQAQPLLQPLQPQQQLWPTQPPPFGPSAHARAQRNVQAATGPDGGAGGESTGGGAGNSSSSGGSRRGRLLDPGVPRVSSSRMPQIIEHMPTPPETESLDPAHVVVSRPLAGADGGRSPGRATGAASSSLVHVWGLAAGTPGRTGQGETAAADCGAAWHGGRSHAGGAEPHDADTSRNADMLLLSSNLDGAGDVENSFQSPFVFGQPPVGRHPALMNTFSDDGTERGTSAGMGSAASDAVPPRDVAVPPRTASQSGTARYAVVEVLASGPLAAPLPPPPAMRPSWQLPTHQHAQHLPLATWEPHAPAPPSAGAASTARAGDSLGGPTPDAVAAAVHAAVEAAPSRGAAAAVASGARPPSATGPDSVLLAVSGAAEAAGSVASACAMAGAGGGSSGARHAGLWPSPDIDSAEGVEPSLALFSGEANSCSNHANSKLSSGANGVSGANALASAAANLAAGGRGNRARLAAVMTLGNWSLHGSLDAEGAGAVGGGGGISGSSSERSGRGSSTGWNWLRAGIKAAVAHGSSKEKDASLPAASRGRKRGFGPGK
ncbi:hypothetical protein HXX76_007866 [Chlamydomonas incerta]|uniref:Uncharacterized protein n=1 Tax=Chlamydomonas incerta TaxID=51695 RepID=A0A835SVT6_CHLIN|nr:hypothetical protein HXX76_007866 [Chlamydomonas incerta]|eukprot:KAG2434139.1 hypothetical protein HXX76_007866 [Chlamydomonas incerta]